MKTGTRCARCGRIMDQPVPHNCHLQFRKGGNFIEIQTEGTMEKGPSCGNIQKDSLIMGWVSVSVRNGYEPLLKIMEMALDQAQNGKGRERHAKHGEPFDKQKICEITRRVGLGYPLGQAIKKAEESLVLGGEEGVAEMLGAINYLAAAVICAKEEMNK